MDMDLNLNSYLTIGGTIITGIVGVILSRQIKSQKEIINHYKGLVEALDPNRIIRLKEAEIDQLKRLADNDINKLRTEAFELGNYVDFILTTYEKTAKAYDKPEMFIRQSVIDMNMPSCTNILNEIHRINQSRPSSSNTPKA